MPLHDSIRAKNYVSKFSCIYVFLLGVEFLSLEIKAVCRNACGSVAAAQLHGGEYLRRSGRLSQGRQISAPPQPGRLHLCLTALEMLSG